MKDQIRTEFEAAFPLPEGVTFDGDHYVPDASVLGAYSNATIWSHMYRGWRMGRETLCVELPFKVSDDNDYDDGYCKAIEDCRAPIHSKGIRTC